MIHRYCEEAIATIWSDQRRFEFYLEAELALLQALEQSKHFPIPLGTAEHIRRHAVVNPQRIEEIEGETRHDMIAFCTSITEQIPADKGRFFHFGVTSSDIIDTALSLQIKVSLGVVLPAFKKLLKTLLLRAQEMKDAMTMGRSHGMEAEPISFGHKLLGHYCEFSRRYRELAQFADTELTAQFSGAVGNYTILTPAIEAAAAALLKLPVEPVSTQVIPRDRIAKLVALNALTASAIERLAVEIRHLHHSDVGELHEGTRAGQKGSSTMPHKKNPISGENLTGIARILKSHLPVALENIVLWHERDISHSSAERLYLPDHLGLLYYALKRLNSTVENLVFHRDTMEAKVRRTGNHLSSYYLHQLLKNTTLSREDIYPLVQQAAFKSQRSPTNENSCDIFHQELNSILKKAGISQQFSPPGINWIQETYLGDTHEIFARAQKNWPLPD